MKMVNGYVLGLGLMAWATGLAGQGDASGVVELSAFPVVAGSLAPGAVAVEQLTARMAREARVDLQSRGGSRYQTDISVRGGIFEGTGLMVGGLALFDPQTGHYFSEIPLDPGFFGGAYLLTGVGNGMQGFNSTAGTIDWQWRPLAAGGSAYVIAGSDRHIGGGARVAARAAGAGFEIGVMQEQGDGSIANGDFDLKRISGRLEYGLGGGTLRVFGGYLEKFYGWPGMYTGRALNETDDYAVSLLGWQWESGDRSAGEHHRIGGYWRRLDDDYEFRRETPNQFFEHSTEVFSLQGDGTMALEPFDLDYRWVAVHDDLRSSTSLVNGDFSERNYAEAALLARRTVATTWGEWAAYGGGAIDTSNRDSTVGLAHGGLSAGGIADGSSWKAYMEFAETSQVPGYTALKSPPSGLFGGNSELGRERARTVEAGVSLQRRQLSGKLVAFQRDDEDLVDWVYASTAPNARRAAAVDIRVRGLEGWLRWEAEATAVELGYAWLDKKADYGDAAVDASFYALNYARHRLLVAVERWLTDTLQACVEAEYRRHPASALRAGGAEALRLNAELRLRNLFGSGWDLIARGDNLTNEDFQPIPGTPGPAREGSLRLTCAW